MGGKRYNKGKPRLGLIPPNAELQIGQVFSFGAEKYDDHNWLNGLKYLSILDSLRRHLNSWYRGEELDPESGLSHLAHAATNAVMLLEMSIVRPEFDDRPKILAPKAAGIGGSDNSSSLRHEYFVKDEAVDKETFDAYVAKLNQAYVDSINPTVHVEDEKLDVNNTPSHVDEQIDWLDEHAKDKATTPQRSKHTEGLELPPAPYITLKPVVKPDGTVEVWRAGLLVTEKVQPEQPEYVLPDWVEQVHSGILKCSRCGSQFYKTFLHVHELCVEYERDDT